MVIYTDGGARGNPGPAACAFVAEENGNVVYKESKFLGRMTNNQAEYQGVTSALQWVAQLPITNYQLPINFFMDSELIAHQINGKYKVKDAKLKGLFFEVQNLLGKIPTKVIFKNIPRAENKLADFLVNQELDKRSVGSANFQ